MTSILRSVTKRSPESRNKHDFDATKETLYLFWG